MIQAEYKGTTEVILGCELRSGKVYPIITYCENNRLVVRIKKPLFSFELSYRNLEEFCKYWKVRAVYREQSRTQTARKRG
jgi:hypothetical protein